MTRELALNRLTEHIRLMSDEPLLEEDIEAMKYAISAIKQEPCEDATLKINKSALKSRIADKVVYNVEWLKKHWQTEMEIVCGVQPCEDAISREAVIKAVDRHTIDTYDGLLLDDDITCILEDLPSVQPSHKGQTVCDLCKFNPPSSTDGNPCTMCPAETIDMRGDTE